MKAVANCRIVVTLEKSSDHEQSDALLAARERTPKHPIVGSATKCGLGIIGGCMIL